MCPATRIEAPRRQGFSFAPFTTFVSPVSKTNVE